MKQQDIQMQKAKNVIKILLLLLSINCFSQIKLEGTYKSNKGNVLYLFDTDGVFNMKTFETTHGQLNGYAKGHYFIIKDKLILNYDLTELREKSYNKSRSFINTKNSIQVKLNIYNFKKEPLNNIQIWSSPNYKSSESDKNGVALLKFEKQNKRIMIEVSGEYFVKESIYIDTNLNYEIDVFLSSNEVYNLSHPLAYKNDKIEYEILKLSKDSIKLKKGKHTFVWKKKSN